jgi:hypothetical protein
MCINEVDVTGRIISSFSVAKYSIKAFHEIGK